MGLRGKRLKFAVLGAFVLAAACAVNPVTGKRELMLLSEGQEIPVKIIEIDRMGRLNLSYIDAIDPEGERSDSSDRGDRGGDRSGGNQRRGGDKRRS